MASVERIINVQYVKNPGYELKNNHKNKRKENPEVSFRDILKREIEEERISKNPYLIGKNTKRIACLYSIYY